MGDSYTVLWTGDHCRRLKRAGDGGRPLRVVFGGSHLSQPSLTRFGVAPGDDLFPIKVEKGRLFLLARMTVREFVTVEQYVTGFLDLPSTHSGLPAWELEQRLATERRDWGHLLPWGCLTEVAIGEAGTPIHFDLVVPPDTVERLRFVSKRGERGIKHVENGCIKSSVSLQGGVFRLRQDSAAAFAALLHDCRPPGHP